MDVRTINTKNRILNGLIKVLSTQKLSECRTINIINQAEVSKKTFYNYFKNKKDFIHWVETNILTSLKNALQKDRTSLEDTHNASEQKLWN
jgi:Transcriptional regulator